MRANCHAVTLRRGRTMTLTCGALLATALLLAWPGGGAAGLGVDRAAAAQCPGSGKGPQQVTRSRMRHAVVCMVNKKRTGRGLSKVRGKDPLHRAGKRHSRYMRRHNCFSHRCGGEKDLSGRVHSTNYLPCTCSWGLGENLGWGKRRNGSARGIVRSWMHSSPHRSVILTGGFDHVGVGVVKGTPWSSDAPASTVTANFGYKR